VLSTDQQHVVWMSSVMEDQQDASGLLYRRNRYYNPSAGRFTQEDPIGLAGGLNTYGFANGDPVTYSDPYGLKVCYRGTAKQVQRMKMATEEATGSTITLASESDGRQCISDLDLNVRAATETYARLKEMAENKGVDITLEPNPVRWDRQSYAQHAEGGRIGRVRLTQTTPMGYWSNVSVFGRNVCVGRSSGTLAAVVAHELIGHIYHQTIARPGTDSGEPYAIYWENMYHARAGEKSRCSH
jgi:RHS repeat-associated protein